MKKFLFAVAVGLLSAVPASADEPKPTTAPNPTPVATATTTSGAIYSGSTTGSTRRGLFGRLRSRMGRDNATMTTTPYTGTVITSPAPTTGTGSGTSIPNPMPGTGGSTGGVTKSTDGVVTASGTTTTMMPMTSTMTTSTRTYGQRTGLMARLRARR